MREQSVFLEYRVYRAFVWRSLCDFFPRYFYLAFRSCLEAGDKAQQSSLATSRRPQNGDELTFLYIQGHMIQGSLLTEEFRHTVHLNNGFAFLHIHTNLGCKGTNFYDFILPVNLI